MTKEDLMSFVFGVTERIATSEYAHLIEAWKGIVGGFAVPEIIKEDPNFLEEHPEYKEMVEKYSKFQVKEEDIIAQIEKAPVVVEAPAPVQPLTTHAAVQAVREAINPQPVAKQPSNATSSSGSRASDLSDNAPSGKNRRIKVAVNKQIFKKRDLTPADRADVITWMNENQRMLTDEDTNKLVALINSSSNAEEIYPYQIAGCFGQLIRKSLVSDADFQSWWEAHCRRFGNPGIIPRYSPDFVKMIQDHYLQGKQERSQRMADHRRIIAERQGVGTIEVPSLVPKPLPKSAPSLAEIEF